MSDRELLELAAKSIGLDIPEYGPWGGLNERWGVYRFNEDGSRFQSRWNPLTDDGDALRLAETLKINVQPTYTQGGVFSGWHCHPYCRGDCAATDFDIRRAITRAAAEIGRAMP